MSDAEWRVLALCHERRNKAEYEGTLELDDRLLADLISVAGKLLLAADGRIREDYQFIEPA